MPTADLPTAETLVSGAEATLAAGLGGTPQLRIVEAEHFVNCVELRAGGMGRIFTAHDPRLRRTVAVKELRVQSPELRARFEREAMLTARLEHPSIVGIHEAGRWPSGEPFFAMRLVRGRSLDEAIAATTTFAQRIALVPHVLAVADALAYAHHERVIHRDLKPHNVMVGDFGETVVIDWGLAKDLAKAEPAATAATHATDDASATTDGEILGTPHFMPPEQAAGEPVDERADVYAIGAMLYHVLAARPPYEGATASAVLDAVATRAPTPLTERQRDVPPDLVAIVERAMARDPAARYPSARELADDLRRFQDGRLVGARRYSVPQLIWRWVLRHRAAVLVATIASAALVGLGAFSIARIMREERTAHAAQTLAERSRADSDELLQFMLHDLAEKLRPLGKLDLLEVVARKARDHYARQPGSLDASELRQRGNAHFELASVLLEQGDSPGGLAELRASLEIADELARAHPDDERVQRDLVRDHRAIGDALVARGTLDDVLASYRTSLAIAIRLAALHPSAPEAQLDVAIGQGKLGEVLEARGDLVGALSQFRTYRDLLANLTRTHREDTFASQLSVAQDAVARLLRQQGDLVGARTELEASKTITEQLLARAPADAQRQRAMMVSHSTLGEVIAMQGDGPGALAEYRAALTLCEQLAQRDPTNASAQRDLAVAHQKIGEVLEQQGSDALEQFREGLAIYSRLAAQDPTNAVIARDRVVAHNSIGRMLARRGDHAAALTEYREAQTIIEGLARAAPTNAGLQRDLVASHLNVGRELATTDVPGALVEYRVGLELARGLAAADATDLDAQRNIEVIRNKIGNALVARDPVGALAEYRASEAIARALALADPTNRVWQYDLAITLARVGAALAASGEDASALIAYREAHGIFDQLLALDPTNADWKNNLGELDAAMTQATRARGRRRE